MTDHNIDEFLKNTPWAQVQRLKYIERCLLWSREISSANIADAFSVTRQRAHQDIATYKEFAPRNVQPYSASSRTYRASINFRPMLLKNDIEGVVSTQGVNSQHAAYVPKIERKILAGVIPALLSAIEEGHSIKTLYASKDQPEGVERIMHPVCVVFTLNSAHLRAFCRERREYHDFLLSRFKTVPTFVEPELIPDDTDFTEEITLRLIVNPNLTDKEFDLMSQEYGITSSKDVTIKKCCVSYFLRENNLPANEEQLEQARLQPWSFPLTLYK